MVLPGRRGTWWSTAANSTCVLYPVEQLAEAAVLAGRCRGSTQPCYSPEKYLFLKKEYSSMAVPSFMLAHSWRVEGSVCSADDFSPTQAPAVCW